jgi:Protein of unknown function (DUF2809)
MRYLKSHSIRLLLIINIVAVILLGYIVRFSHLFTESIHHIAGCIFYEVLWILVGAFLYPRVNRKPIAIWVFLGTCGIEFLKLYQPQWLQAIRATLPGRLILGTNFDFYNLPVYLFGSYLGWLWIKFLDSQFQKPRQKFANNPNELER